MFYDLLALTPLPLHDVRNWEGADFYFTAQAHLDCACCDPGFNAIRFMIAFDAGKAFNLYV